MYIMDPLFFDHKLKVSKMEDLQVVRQIQNVPEKVISQRKQTIDRVSRYFKKRNKSQIVLIKAKLAYRSIRMRITSNHQVLHICKVPYCI